MRDILRKSAIMKINEQAPKEDSLLAQRLAAIFEATTDLVAIADISGKLLYLNRGGKKLLGCADTEQSEKYKYFRDLLPAREHRSICGRAIIEANGSGAWQGETTLLCANGQELEVSMVIITHKNESEAVDYISVVARDISDIKKADQALQIFAKIFESTQEGIMITDAQKQILSVNPAFSHVTGYSLDEAIGKNPRMLQSGRHDKDFYKNFWHTLTRTGQWQGEIWNRRKSGEIYPEWLNICTIRGEHGEITNYVAIFSDISSIKVSQERLAYLAHHDALTGLPNRVLLNDRVDRALAQAARSNKHAGVLFVDLDRFKPINDTLGHNIGDLVLQAVAERMKSCVRECDTVARLGGDEFAVILVDINSPHDAARVANKLLISLSQPFAINGHMINIGASIGISLFPGDAKNGDDLLKRADEAMYEVKRSGRNSFRFYTSSRR